MQHPHTAIDLGVIGAASRRAAPPRAMPGLIQRAIQTWQQN